MDGVKKSSSITREWKNNYNANVDNNVNTNYKTNK